MSQLYLHECCSFKLALHPPGTNIEVENGPLDMLDDVRSSESTFVWSLGFDDLFRHAPCCGGVDIQEV